MSNDLTSVLAQHPQLSAIIDKGAREGTVTYQFINEQLGDLAFDEEASEALFEVLEKRGIRITDEVASKPASPSPVKAKSHTPTAPAIADAEPPKSIARVKPKGAHSDLDDVLASLEELMNSPFGELLARDDAAAEGATDEEGAFLGEQLEDSFTQYMNRMGRIPRLDEAEEKELARRMHTGSDEERAAAREKLVEANMRLVVSLAKRYTNRPGMLLIDLVQEGNLGLVRAVERWDPDRGTRLGSYATWYIRESINASIAAQARTIRLPGHVSGAIRKLQRLQREVAQTMGRAPSMDELAEAAGMTVEQVRELLRMVAEPLSFETPMGEDQASTLGDLLAAPDEHSPAGDLTHSELNSAVSIALVGLTDRERAVITQRFGLGDYASGGPATTDDIAKRMHLPRDSVRTLELKALRKMRRRTRGTVLEGLFDGTHQDDA